MLCPATARGVFRLEYRPAIGGAGADILASKKRGCSEIRPWGRSSQAGSLKSQRAATSPRIRPASSNSPGSTWASEARAFSSICSGRVAPVIADATLSRRKTQASANWAEGKAGSGRERFKALYGGERPAFEPGSPKEAAHLAARCARSGLRGLAWLRNLSPTQHGF